MQTNEVLEVMDAYLVLNEVNISQLPMDLRGDHHSKFRTKNEKVIFEDKVLDSLLDLDEVSQFPHSREQLTSNFKSFLDSLNAMSWERAIDVVSSSPGLSSIQRTRGKKNIYSV
ncbi:hypothetical protein ACH5RR_026326 [Cinchona calisaya]|uniref:Uncharacterized protein n=1 Tax=Cinchona calisaya TaxID=153742 RepID=A0ABD2Z4E5_9GENT